MKAILCKAWGLPDTLVVEEVADLTPPAKHVVIDVHAAGVNFPDVLIIQNKYQFKPELPFTPGSELAGVIRAVGEGVTHLKVGDKVIAFFTARRIRTTSTDACAFSVTHATRHVV